MISTHQTGTASDENEFDRSLIEAIYEASPDGILVVDDKAMIVSHNQRLFEVFGITPEELTDEPDEGVVGLPDQPLLSRVLELVKHRDSFLKRVQTLYDNPKLDDFSEIELKDGRTLERHSKSLWSPTLRYLGRVWFFRDITLRKRTEDALREMLRRDPLTGAANRRYFFERAVAEFARAKRYARTLSLIAFDIDRFKRINDRWGHAAGDKVLKNLCDSAQSILRKEDLFARTGGEEFVVLVPDTNIESAFRLAERLRELIAEQAVTEDTDTINYTISLGVAAVTPEDVSIESALRRADDALYAAKHAGRNRTLRESVE